MSSCTFAFKENFQTLFPGKPPYLPSEYPDLTGKIALVTGTSSGVGKETARLLLEQNATVVFANRNKSKTDEATKEIIKEVEKNKKSSKGIEGRIIQCILDLSDLTTIKPAVEELKQKIDRLDYVILNAGVMQPPNGSVTKQGWELQYGTNVLGHQLLVDLINPLIHNAISKEFSPRVVFVSSIGSASSPKNGGLTWDFKNATKAGSIEIYGQSKAANIYQANIYGQDNKDVISVAVHPGLLATELMRSYPDFVSNLAKKTASPPVFGSYTELFAALSPTVTTKDNGRYIAPWGNFREIRSDLREGVENGTARKMWDYNEEQIKEFV